jgi:nitroreductase
MSRPAMQLYDVMRTTFAAREFTDDPLPDEVLGRIFDNARFAPSGGNRQGAHVTVVRDETVRRRLAELGKPAARRYFAQLRPRNTSANCWESPTGTRWPPSCRWANRCGS